MPCQGPWAPRQQASRGLATLHRVHVRPGAFRCKVVQIRACASHELQALQTMLALSLVVGFLFVLDVI